MKKTIIILPLLALLALSGCVKKNQMLDDIGPLTYEEGDTSYLPQSDARCQPLDESEILESFPLEAGDEEKYSSIDDEPLINMDDAVETQNELVGRVAYGKASWYGKKFHGNKTASGERYNMYDNTAAHKQLPFNSLIKITDIATGKSEIVRINDRGPFHSNRIIDVSFAAAETLGLVRQGTGDVKLEILKIGFDPRCRPLVKH
jgi:rare lipoprotein A